MPQSVALVTDSTAELALALGDGGDASLGELGWGVGMVPLHVVVDGTSHREGVDLDAERLASALDSRAAVTTASPGPSEFEAAWRSALDAGAEHVVSVHLSSKMSATGDVARSTASMLELPVTVIDSRSVSGGLAAPVLAGARAAAAGADLDAVVDVVNRTIDRTQVRFVVESLDRLRRGGRIGAAQAFLGTALSVKPLLQVARDGSVDGWQKVRTLRAARQALLAWGQETATTAADAVIDSLTDDEFSDGEGTAVDVTVHHLERPETAKEMAAALRAAVDDTVAVRISRLGATVGAHTGVGTVAIVVSPRVEGDPGRWTPAP
ncbi:DegV family protein [Kytococcus sedentarius]|uniref:DegV family protein n=1 Tax=Kytococcus sedentarius (strain ATCC 14392 / DSM 20547 / JCM 11482 / CCUG 33030 / NBRC 15357 / NCTC 11040 / CCM 314 / 541) TaxID=478801 RepID=C7NJ60_KYTSD|nr:DegV family protein [Kytococcus sedentarius]ACV06747.1 degV family protein [Kytococcus sedentarius DSM 20547]QQB65020.1 DegV family protein [Kytococcus sedentarius]STX14438.1 DegV domain-containing protein SAV1425 [Kytococcus sedentarius]